MTALSLLEDFGRALRELLRPMGRKGPVSAVTTMLGIRPRELLVTSVFCQTGKEHGFMSVHR